MEKKALECEIAVMLRILGVQPDVRGWRYIVDGVMMTVENEELLHQLTKGLYPAIARKNGSTASKVERCIRSAIETAWTQGSTEAQQHYFGSIVGPEKGKPTNGAFIGGLAQWARRRSRSASCSAKRGRRNITARSERNSRCKTMSGS